MRSSKQERDMSFAEFMNQAGPALLRTAWFLTGDTDHAQELAQAALVKTYLVWHKIDRDNPLAYARRCLVNHKIDVWRATRHEVVADLTSAGFELLSATHTSTTGIVLAETGRLIWGGQLEVGFDRDTRVGSNVRYSVVGQDGLRHELGASSTGKPGQEPTAHWKSGLVDGHPVTIGVFPGGKGDALAISFANGISYPIGVEELTGTGYAMFYVDYAALANEKERAVRPSEIASIRYSRPSGAIDGVEGDHRLSGRVLTLSKTLSVDVVLRPAAGGRTTVFGQTHLQDGSFSIGFDLSAATTDPRGVAVATGRAANITTTNGQKVGVRGAPIAAGILPAGASNIVMTLSANTNVAALAVSDRLSDGRVIFAINGDIFGSRDPSKDVVTAVMWTNADGTEGRVTVTQKQGR
jgi:Sigma-70 region 2